MFFFKEEHGDSVVIGKVDEQIDREILFHWEQCGNWREVIDNLLMEPVEDIRQYSYRILTAFALWGLEEYEGGGFSSGPAMGGGTPGGWNL